MCSLGGFSFLCTFSSIMGGAANRNFIYHSWEGSTINAEEPRTVRVVEAKSGEH